MDDRYLKLVTELLDKLSTVELNSIISYMEDKNYIKTDSLKRKLKNSEYSKINGISNTGLSKKSYIYNLLNEFKLESTDIKSLTAIILENLMSNNKFSKLLKPQSIKENVPMNSKEINYSNSTILTFDKYLSEGGYDGDLSECSKNDQLSQIVNKISNFNLNSNKSYDTNNIDSSTSSIDKEKKKNSSSGVYSGSSNGICFDNQSDSSLSELIKINDEYDEYENGFEPSSYLEEDTFSDIFDQRNGTNLLSSFLTNTSSVSNSVNKTVSCIEMSSSICPCAECMGVEESYYRSRSSESYSQENQPYFSSSTIDDDPCPCLICVKKKKRETSKLKKTNLK